VPPSLLIDTQMSLVSAPPSGFLALDTCASVPSEYTVIKSWLKRGSLEMSTIRSSLPAPVRQRSSPNMEKHAQGTNGATGPADSDNSSTCSFDPEYINFIEEHGRRYHSAEMIQPNDNQELELQVVRHEMWRLVCGGELCLLPWAAALNAKRVLDLGTGLGSWAFDFAAQHSGTTVIGVDMTPVQPEWVPPNCHFEIDDLRETWTWSKPFDLIHARGLSGSFGLDEFRQLVRQVYEYVALSRSLHRLTAPRYIYI